ncbi:class I SAM-dependent methyltransferase [Allobranchiibius sp. CTAmp26]|uniref:class I SAM-dependent methyltransferase n=1 Tax=Allobranchiibius sp. CTAmp26 TaxID=2815214 RepID=UPI001AA0F448|nr:class I SAM-dependent methyltransferase [Allobranchiibius sp. CTAmp26]MBO1756607.1 transferase [Allobranchiibius sp. CTAmp26]
MTEHRCRACGGSRGTTVLDLGEQPAADHFPPASDPGPDPRFALSMWWCADCCLAQLAEDETSIEEPRGLEPRALVLQAQQALAQVAEAGFFQGRSTVGEFPSPHGGSWLGDAAAYGPTIVADGAAEVLVDSFGIMHERDQAAGVRRRAQRLAPGGVLLLQYQSLDSIVSQGAWNALRHGHFGYYSLLSLEPLLAQAGLRVLRAWDFDLYGGTVLLAVARAADRQSVHPSVALLAARDRASGMADPTVLATLQDHVDEHIAWLRRQLRDRRAAGRTVLGYGAASRAAALLAAARADTSLLPAIADGGTAKHGRRMPGTDIPIVSPAQLLEADPDDVMLFLPDLLPEVTRSFPQLAGRWIAGVPSPPTG